MNEATVKQVSLNVTSHKKAKEAKKEDPRVVLLAYKERFEKQIIFAQSQKERIENLMVRYSAGRLSVEKRQRMVRRHTTAVTMIDQSQKLLDQVNLELNELERKANDQA